MNNLNPTFKFIGILIPTVLLLFFFSPVLNLLIFALSLGAVLMSRCSKKVLFITLVPVFLSAVSLFFTGMRFPAQSHLALNYKLFASSALWNGLQLSSRLLAFAGLGILFALTTDRVEMVRSARQQLKAPVKFAYGLLAAFGIMPNVLTQYRKSRAAFRSRGLSPAPWSPALLKPVLVKTVRWSEALAMAMESKGFGDGGRTEYYVLNVTAKDVLFPLLTTALFFAAAAADSFITPFFAV